MGKNAKLHQISIGEIRGERTFKKNPASCLRINLSFSSFSSNIGGALVQFFTRYNVEQL